MTFSTIDCHAQLAARGDTGTLRAALAAAQIDGAVLIAPADDESLIAALAAQPERLRGIVPAAPGLSRAAIERLQGAGVAGLRLDLADGGAPDLAAPGWRALIDMAGWRGLHFDIDADGEAWADILPPLLDAGVRVVIDHFGRPQGGLDGPGFRALCDAARRGDLWIKLSAPECCAGATPAAYAAAILDAFGPQRVVWGSSRPLPDPDGSGPRLEARDRLAAWVPDAALRRAILADNPAALYGFGAPADGGAAWPSFV